MATYKPISEAILAFDSGKVKRAIKSNPDAVAHWKPIMDAAYTARPEVVSRFGSYKSAFVLGR